MDRCSVTAIPYLEGDYWPGEAENLLSQIAGGGGGAGSGGNRKAGSNKGKRYGGGAGTTDEQLLGRLGEILGGNMREDFMVVHLQEPCSFCRGHVTGSVLHKCVPHTRRRPHSSLAYCCRCRCCWCFRRVATHTRTAKTHNHVATRAHTLLLPHCCPITGTCPPAQGAQMCCPSLHPVSGGLRAFAWRVAAPRQPVGHCSTCRYAATATQQRPRALQADRRAGCLAGSRLQTLHRLCVHWRWRSTCISTLEGRGGGPAGDDE